MDSGHHGLSLGLQLTIYLSLIVGLVMGGITFIQRLAEINRHHEVYENLLRESLVPLTASLKNISSMTELQEAIEQFHLSYNNSGYPRHEVVLQDENGEVIFTTFPDNKLKNQKEYFVASMPLHMSALKDIPLSLVVYKDRTEYEHSIQRQWLFWTFHVALTLLTIFLFLLPAVHYLVTRPIKNLVKGIKKMEMGYWGKVPTKSGAWEIRWLACRFENMVSEVRKTVAHLLEAERKAQNLIAASFDKNSAAVSKNPVPLTNSADNLSTPVYHDLERKCHLLESVSPDDPSSQKLARQIWREDVAKAERLGCWEIKSRIENAALRLLDPETYHQLNTKLLENYESHRQWAKKNGQDLRRSLEKSFIPYVDISYRVKHTAGVWKKMQSKSLDLDEIHDLHAFRVIVPTESDCYTALAAVHHAFKPVIGRFKDYVAHPKQNGYQSLHTCVMAAAGPIFEIQIRSLAMHHHSENGTAAHWLYKTDSASGLRVPEKTARWPKMIKALKKYVKVKKRGVTLIT